MENKIIISVAVTGSRPTKEMNPAVPYSPKGIAQAAVESHKAGAAIAHIHVREPETGKPAFRIELFREVLDRIRQQCDMIVNLTTSGLFLDGPDVISQRLQPVNLEPDICSFDLGSMNFRDRVFVNPPEWSEAAPKAMRDRGVKPEIEVFDVGHLYQALDLVKRGFFEEPPFFQLCMGTQWGLEATAENLLFMTRKLPSNAIWSVLGVGKAQLPMISLAMILGGHARVGFEDNIYLKRGVLASSNAELVEMAVDLAERLQRPVATSTETRKILGIKPRS
jgi:3-keto-5-aminohexanoate cleavage enzyme